jgi:hypothetical protein
MCLGSNGRFMADTALTSYYYRMDIISGMSHPRSDLIVLLVLCMVAYNIWGTSVILQVHRDNANPTGMGNISGRSYC